MRYRFSRKLIPAIVLLLCILAVGLVLSNVIYCAHTMEGHCDCAVCRIVSVIGVAFVLVLSCFVVASLRTDGETARRPYHAFCFTPVSLAVKLSC